MDEHYHGYYLSLLAEWAATYDQMTATNPLARKMAAELQEAIDACQKVINEGEMPYRARLANLEAEIAESAVIIAKSHSAAGVAVKFTSGYERASWDDRALQGYAVEHPALLVFRKVTPVKAVVKVSRLAE